MITQIDDNLFANLSKLIKLNLSNNRLKYIPSTIRIMSNLQELFIDKNDITSFFY